MRNVLILSASPRRLANSDILADAAASGAREAGANVTKVRLAQLRIEPCDACDACQSTREAPCVKHDAMQDLYPQVLAAESLLVASPIYFFSVSAQLKLFMDRLYALGGGGDWTALAGTRLGLILTYGDSNVLHSGVANAYGMFRDAARFLGLQVVDVVHTACGGEGEVRQNPAALDAARLLGQRLGSG